MKFSKCFLWLSIGVILFTLPETSFAQDGNDMLRSIHAGGNWGENKDRGIAEQPEDYYKLLNRLSVNWAGISVALHVDNSMDSTVERDTSDGHLVPTLTDDNLRNMIRGFTSRGINVLLSLAFETQEASQSQFPFQRWQLGDTFAHNNDPNIQAENWPWNPGHPNHATFVDEFWTTYIEQAAHFARIAEEENVVMFSIGAETDRLFRTRVGGMFPNEFKNYIQSMVDSVRTNYSGSVTYEQHWSALTETDVFGESTSFIWDDVGLDVIGISAYFQLADAEPGRVMTTGEFETKWNTIFDLYLTPLQTNNPGKSIYFLEFGYVDAVNSAFNAAADEFTPYMFIDNNNNSLDDGQEQQKNIIESFYTVNAENDNIVKGTFLWDFQIASDFNWTQGFGNMRTFSIRNKPAEELVANHYASFAPIPDSPQPLSPEDDEEGLPIIFLRLEWQTVTGAISYNVQLSKINDFSSLVFNGTEISMTSIFVPDTLEVQTEYFWRVQSVSPAGTSEWSQVFTFLTTAPVGYERASDFPATFKLYQNFPNPFNPTTIIKYELSNPSWVSMSIYDMLGSEVTTVVNEFKQAGLHEIIFDANKLAGGVYFYTINIDKFIKTRKLILIK